MTGLSLKTFIIFDFKKYEFVPFWVSADLNARKPPNTHSNESFHFLSVEGTSFVDCAYCLNKGGFILDGHGSYLIEIVMTHQKSISENTKFYHL